MVRETTQSDDTGQSIEGAHPEFDTDSRSRREVLTKGTAGSIALALGVTGATGPAAGLQDDEEEDENGDEEETETPEEAEDEEAEDEEAEDEEAEDEDEEPAEVDFQNQESDGQSVTVESVTLPEGGFVVIHDATLLEGDALGSTIGTSEYLDEGEHEDVEVDLFDVPGAEFDISEISQTLPLVAMPHRDTDGDEEFGFVETDGDEDGPYTTAGQAVVELAYVVVE